MRLIYVCMQDNNVSMHVTCNCAKAAFYTDKLIATCNTNLTLKVALYLFQHAI